MDHFLYFIFKKLYQGISGRHRAFAFCLPLKSPLRVKKISSCDVTVKLEGRMFVCLHSTGAAPACVEDVAGISGCSHWC